MADPAKNLQFAWNFMFGAGKDRVPERENKKYCSDTDYSAVFRFFPECAHCCIPGDYNSLSISALIRSSAIRPILVTRPLTRTIGIGGYSFSMIVRI